MATIRNTSHKPVRVPLPLGKALFLGPNKSGQITQNAVDHPAVQELIAAGAIELTGEAQHGQRPEGTGGGVHPGATHGHVPTNQPQRRGDRGG